jgi:hemoglobin
MKRKFSYRMLLVLTPFVLGGLAAGQDKAPATAKSADKSLPAVLRTIINTGADLFNRGDHAGCYRLFQGALLAVHPQLESHPELQKAVDDALANAQKKTGMDDRAFVLRDALDKVRNGLKAEADKKAAANPEEAIPTVPKPVGTKPVETTPKPPVPKPDESKPLTGVWEKLGGEAKVIKIVDDFVTIALQDTRVDFTRGGKYQFDEAGLAGLKKSFVDLISQATGGPRKYTGKRMKDVHKNMSITENEFNNLVRCLQKALDKNKVPTEVIQFVLEEVKKTQDDIVETKTNKTINPDERRQVLQSLAEKPAIRNPDADKGRAAKIEDKKANDKTSAVKTPVNKTPIKESPEFTGTVTLDGKPLPDAEIRFFPKDMGLAGRVWAVTDNQGRFSVRAIKSGEYVVSVQGDDLPIPAKYTNPKSSGLAVTVSGKDQPVQIELKK